MWIAKGKACPVSFDTQYAHQQDELTYVLPPEAKN